MLINNLTYIATLRMCAVSHPLPPHAHPALTSHPTMPHSLSMHKMLKCILPPTPVWCSCQVTTFLILISQLPMRLTLHGGSSSGNIENKFLYNQCACRSFSEMRELACGITTFNSKLKSTGNVSFIYWFIVCLINRKQY